MWLMQAKAIARKELCEGLRTGWKFALQILVMVAFLNWFVVRSYVAMVGKDAKLLQLAASISMVYVALMVIPFIANALLIRSLVEERNRQTILPILATGAPPAMIWLTKLAVVFVLSYAVMLVSLGLHLLVMIYYWHVMPLITTQILFGVLVVTPLLALAIVAFTALVFWAFYHTHLVASVVPVVVAMSTWGFANRSPGADILHRITVVSFVASTIIIIIGALCIARMPRRRIAGF